MNNNERILHILDQSTCLTRRQMKEYLGGTMLPEEIHAAEMHISSCPLCSMALDGFEAHTDEALEAISSLNSGFLKEHFDAITPKIHLNSIAPAASFSGRKHKKKSISLWKVSGVAAAFFLGFGALWMFSNRHDQPAERAIASNDVLARQPAAPKMAATAKTDREPLLTETSPAASKNTKPDAVTTAPNASLKNGTDANLAAASVVRDEGRAMPTQSATTPDAAKPVALTGSLKKSPAAEADEVVMTTTTYETKKGTGVAIGGGRANNTSYTVDGIQVSEANKEAVVASRSKAAPPSIGLKDEAKKTEDHLAAGDEYFDRSKYSAALAHYNKEIQNSRTPKRKSQATLMAARCYRELGNRKKAIALLEDVVANGSGPERRQAKRLLRTMED